MRASSNGENLALEKLFNCVGLSYLFMMFQETFSIRLAEYILAWYGGDVGENAHSIAILRESPFDDWNAGGNG